MKIDFTTLRKKWSRPPKHQFPTGTRAYKGFQGSGKTLTMIHDALELFNAFPNSHLFSNVLININDKRYHYFNDVNGMAEAISFQNGRAGVIVLVDEAHLFFNKKRGISLDVLTAISQQRKDRRKILISSQIWEDLDVSLRKQVKEIVNCRNFLNKWQINIIHDGETLHWDKTEGAYIAKKMYTYIYKHNNELYNMYNTYQKIVTNDEYTRQMSNTNVVYAQAEKK